MRETQLGATFIYFKALLDPKEAGWYGSYQPALLALRKIFIRRPLWLIANMLSDQIEEDRYLSAVFAPWLIFPQEVYIGEEGTWYLDLVSPPLVRKADVVIQEVENDDSRIVKWQSTCNHDVKENIPDILRDYWFAQRASKLGVSQSVYFLSTGTRRTFGKSVLRLRCQCRMRIDSKPL
jgi:hypothetical protein